MTEEIVPILRVKDALRAAAWYARIGFEFQWVHRFEPHLPAFVCVARGPMRIFLSEHLGDARPDTLIYIYVDDVYAMAEALGTHVHVQDWGHEFEIKDPDGNRLRINTPQVETDVPSIEVIQAVERDAVDVLQRLDMSETDARAAVAQAMKRQHPFLTVAELVQDVLRRIHR